MLSGYPGGTSGSVTESDGSFTVTGAGDIAPAVRGTLPTGGTAADLLTGTFAALIAVIVVGTLFITAEYRQDLIRTTLAASRRPVQVLAAKVIVLGVVTFAGRRHGLADPGDAGLGLRSPAAAWAVSAGPKHLHAVQRLLPGGAVGRARRPGRLCGGEPGRGSHPAAQERRMRLAVPASGHGLVPAR